MERSFWVAGQALFAEGRDMTERLSSRLRRLADPIWQAQRCHPFITGMSDGSLPLDRFTHWMRQDYLYLIEYSRALSLAAARSPDAEAMTKLAALANATLGTELSLHRSYASQFGISSSELAAERMSPTCQAYTDFLVRTAGQCPFPEVVAALLPCMWGFSEVGLALEAKGLPEDERYAQWVQMYASEAFAEEAAWCRDLLDRVGADLPSSALGGVEESFLASSRYELQFWEMAWTLERWPV